MDDLCDLAKTLLKPGSHGYAFISGLQCFSLWPSLSSLTEEKEAASGREAENLEIKQEKAFEVQRATLIYTRAFGHY